MRAAGPGRTRGRRIAVASLLLAAAAFAATGFVVTGPLLEAWHLRRLDSDDPAARAKAVEWLAGRRSPRAIPGLARIVEEAAPTLCRPAAVALHELGAEGREALVAAVDDAAGPIREEVLDALEARGAPPDFLALVLEGGLEDGETRGTFLHRVWGDPRLVPPLVAALTDAKRSRARRAGIAGALANPGLGDGELHRHYRDALPVLEPIAHDPSEAPEVRGPLYDAIERITGEDLSSCTLRIPDVVARPGEKVAIEVRGTFRRPLRGLMLKLRVPPSVAKFVRAGSAWTTPGGRDRRGLAADVGEDGAVLIGHVVLRSDAPVLVEPADDAPLVDAVFEVPPGASPGAYAIAVTEAVVLGIRNRPLGARVEAGVLSIERTPAAGTSADAEGAPPTPSLRAAIVERGVELSWDAAALAPDGETRLSLLRNGRRIADVGGRSSWLDRYRSDLRTVYELRDGDGAAIASAALNEFGAPFSFRAEIVEVTPGEEGVELRVFATNGEAVQGFSFGLRIDAKLARIREIRDGAAIEAAGLGSFMYQRHVLDGGETAVGALDMSPPLAHLEAGCAHHVATIVLDIAADAPPGTAVPVEFGAFGTPPASTIFTVGGHSRETRTWNGAVLVGPSPAPPVAGATAVELLEERGQVTDAIGIRLEWKSPPACAVIEIERNGERVATLPGDSTSFLDAAAGPGAHHYRIRASRRTPAGERWSFPVEVEVSAIAAVRAKGKSAPAGPPPLPAPSRP